MRRRRIALLALAGFTAAAFLGGSAASRPSASPVFRVDWTLAAYDANLPNIAETQVEAKGRLTFSKPLEDPFHKQADNSSGVVVARFFDTFTESGTVRTLTFRVTGGDFYYSTSRDSFSVGAALRVIKRKNTVGTGLHCPLGSVGRLSASLDASLVDQAPKYAYNLFVEKGCDIEVQGSATAETKGQIHTTIDIKCLQRKPLCSGLKLASGTYRADAALGSTHFPSTWKLRVSGNQITGTSTWSCCPGTRHDPLIGTVTGTHVAIMRDCTGQGYVGECSQRYTGTLVSSGHVKGTWSDVTGPTGSGTFTLVKT